MCTTRCPRFPSVSKPVADSYIYWSHEVVGDVCVYWLIGNLSAPMGGIQGVGWTQGYMTMILKLAHSWLKRN